MAQKFRLEDIEIYHTIGKGGYGRVKLARAKNNLVFFALKVMKKAHLVKAQQIDHVHSEFTIMSKINNPFIVRFLGFAQDQHYLYYALEFVQGGDLFTYIKLQKSLSVFQATFYSAQIVLVLEYLHKQSIIYRDLKPENLLIKPNGYLKLTDFGLAKVLENRTLTFCGTAEYMAPEIIRNQPYGCAADWWSFGVIIFEMLAGTDPFHDADPMIVYENILNCKIKYPRGFDRAGKSLVKHLLVEDLSKRYGNMKRGALDIKRHSWFKDIEWELLAFQTATPPYLPGVIFQGDTSNFFKYPESQSEPGELEIEDPFKNW